MRPNAIEVVYKMVGDTSLTLHLFLPKPSPLYTHRPAIIFFHGGGFVGDHPALFFQHCTHFASRGMVAASAYYCFLNKGATSIGDCLGDAKSAIR